MQALAVGRGAVLRFILGILFTRLTSLTPETYARRFLRLMHIPEEMRGGADREELKRMAAGLSALRVPQKDALLRELDSAHRRLTVAKTTADELIAEKRGLVDQGTFTCRESLGNHIETLVHALNSVLCETLRTKPVV